MAGAKVSSKVGEMVVKKDCLRDVRDLKKVDEMADLMAALKDI
jgi:hypothetical protein